MIKQRFTDIDLSFTPHPSTGDLMVKRDEQAIKNSIKNLILTMHYERKFHSEIGSSINGLLFNNPSPSFSILLKKEIKDVIDNFEPRAEIISIDIGFAVDRNEVGVEIVFSIVNSSTPITLQFTLDRTR